ncbi:hypothetical protein JW851_00960 [Candidatus Woesearchaeota archaeon]|nr:hypothetical protein [Candidatus Woesearchaeota archaeon]
MAFSKTTLEGLIFLERELVSGFNIENDDFLNAISLNVKYYHNVPKHIKNVINKIEKEIKFYFQRSPALKEHSKIGIFKWQPYFDHEKGNKYYIIQKTAGEINVIPLSIKEMKEYKGNNLLIACDKTRIITFLPLCEQEAQVIYQFLRNKTSKKIISSDGSLINNIGYIDEKCHQVPLFVIKDQNNFIKDKRDLIEVVNLKFKKAGETLQSLITKKKLRKVLSAFANFDCEFKLYKEKRYVSPEFHSYMD